MRQTGAVHLAGCRGPANSKPGAAARGSASSERVEVRRPRAGERCCPGLCWPWPPRGISRCRPG
eukprot:5725591-Pyramimonas_sp.AAC.1